MTEWEKRIELLHLDILVDVKIGVLSLTQAKKELGQITKREIKEYARLVITDIFGYEKISDDYALDLIDLINEKKAERGIEK